MASIKNFTPRLYQETILHTCSKNNCLVVLPTGLGKTKIAILTAVSRLQNYPNSKILVLTPTKPLANQICQEFKECTDIENITLFTGIIPPETRKELWKENTVIVSTPQCIENDLINNNISLKDTSLVVFDEAHRAVKDYSYTWVAKQYQKKSDYARIIALTASPGSELEKITEVCKNLSIEEIEIRSELDPDVKPYVQEMEIELIKIDLPEELREVQKFLKDCFNSKLVKLKDFGYISSFNNLSKTQLLGIQRSLQGQIASGTKDFQLYKAISFSAEALKVQHAIELLETQGTNALYKYLNNIFETASKTKTKAVKSLVIDLNFKSAYIKTRHLLEKEIEHPKQDILKRIIEKEVLKDPKVKIIIFNQYRDSAAHLEKELKKIKGVKPKLFIGQTKKNGIGLSQKEQIAILEDFKEYKYNCIIATSIGEEGLDIPKVELVIFYEPIPSAIRSIQRRGRTARQEKGRIIVLMTKNTRDEAYHWTSFHKEKRMYSILANLKQKLNLNKTQPSLDKFIEKETIKIFVDNREKGSGIIKNLVDNNIEVKMQTLATADYILSKRVGVERKTPQDFVDSIIDKRLLHQIRDLKQNFDRPLIIIEGEEDLYSLRRIHPNAIRGMLATIAISYGIPIIRTKNFQDSAALLIAIAKREQVAQEKEFGVRLDKKPLTTKEQQEFIIESLPGIGPTLAKSLLKKFKTVKKIINAKPEKLKKIEKLGPKKTEEIQRILDEEYPED
ncbi:MAG: DEAD/DEAH box helicase [Nanoarchaeota archaeon]|nr:DEAD/DEAH box helicase [Nanoarchaeota archaeon]